MACFEFIRMINSPNTNTPVDIAGLSVDGKSATGTDMDASLTRADSKAESLTHSDSKSESLTHSDSKADYTNAPTMSEESLAATDRDTLMDFRSKLEDERMKMREVFKKFDISGSKTVSPAELRTGLLGLGIDLDDGQARRLTERFDLQGDGRLHYYEFVKLFHGLPPSCAW